MERKKTSNYFSTYVWLSEKYSHPDLTVVGLRHTNQNKTFKLFFLLRCEWFSPCCGPGVISRNRTTWSRILPPPSKQTPNILKFRRNPSLIISCSWSYLISISALIIKFCFLFILCLSCCQFPLSLTLRLKRELVQRVSWCHFEDFSQFLSAPGFEN